MIAYSFDSLVSTMTTALKEVTDDSPSYFPNIENPNISDWQTNPLQSANQKIGYGMLTVPSQPMITNTMIFNLSLGK